VRQEIVTNCNKYPIWGNSVNRYEAQPGYPRLETMYIHNESQVGYRLSMRLSGIAVSRPVCTRVV
jgi:hypothetical protein